MSIPAPHRHGVDDAALELLGLHMRQWRSSLAGAVAMTALVAASFGYFLDDGRLWVWAALGGMVYGGQWAWCLRAERQPGQVWQSAGMRRTMIGLAVATGLSWGSLGWWMPGPVLPLQLTAALVASMVTVVAASASVGGGQLKALVVPVITLMPAALIWHARLPVAGLAAASAILMVLRYGLLLRTSTLDSIRQRRHVEMISAELLAQQVRLREAEREQATLDERQRLLRDMHDGVGASLIGAVKMLEQGDMSLGEATSVLRECIEDLKLSIDSLELTQGDLAVVLATLRYRLGRRLERSGLRIEWHVADLPKMSWLGPPQALDLLRILQEAFANIVKHAAATCVRISAAPIGLAGSPDTLQSVLVKVEDDGRGFATDSHFAGRGLLHMRQRAGALGVELDVDSVVGSGTCVSLRIGVVPSSRDG